MKIADKVVTESNNLYPFRALMETLLNYAEEVMKTRIKCERYEEDVSLDVTDPAGANTGLKTREVKYNASMVVRLIGRLHSDLSDQEKLIPPGIKLHVQLVPARWAFFIKTAAADGEQVLYKYHNVSARFLIQFKELSIELVTSHKDMDMKENRNYIMPHKKVSMKTLNISS